MDVYKGGFVMSLSFVKKVSARLVVSREYIV